MIRPCDNCQNKNKCSALEFIQENSKKGAWHLNEKIYGLYAFYQPVYLVTVNSDCSEVNLECMAYIKDKRRR